MITSSAESAQAVLSQIKISIRVSYSNPPAHGASIVANILGDSDLREIWQDELTEMRTRIDKMRKLFVDDLDGRGIQIGIGSNHDFLDHHGMFSFTGLAAEQIEALRQEHSIYMLGSSRINFAGLTAETIPVVCDAIVSVSKE